jgi:hypothetical protein
VNVPKKSPPKRCSGFPRIIGQREPKQSPLERVEADIAKPGRRLGIEPKQSALERGDCPICEDSTFPSSALRDCGVLCCQPFEPARHSCPLLARPDEVIE